MSFSFSLRRRLTVILIGLTLITWLVSVLATAIHAGYLMRKQLDRHIVLYAGIAQHSMAAVLEEPQVREVFQARSKIIDQQSTRMRVRQFGGGDAEPGNGINLWFGDSQVLIGESAPVFPPPIKEGMVNRELADGSTWRILYRHFPRFNVWQAVGVDLESARLGGIAIFWRGVLPLLVILPVTMIILFYGIRRGLRPLNALARQISERQLHALEPLDTSTVPEEIKPVVTSLNQLLERLQRAHASEHRFTANAAHELQTPLAAIQAAVQSCQRRLSGIPESAGIDHTLERISDRISSATDTVRQLLTLARLDPDQEFERQPVELGALISDTMAEVGDIAMEAQLSVHFNQLTPAWIEGNSEWLRILLRNLFVNAFRYAPCGSEVDVRIDQQSGDCQLQISNDCEVIPAAEFERLTERFYHPTTSVEHGVGLGLSIAQRIAELHHAPLQISSWKHGRGFSVRVRLPLSPPDARLA